MSLNEINARARVPSGLRYRARLSGNGLGAIGLGAGFEVFLGDDEKKERMPLLEDGTTGTSGGGAGAMALNIVIIWGSRRILSVSVNSSLLCSILQ